MWMSASQMVAMPYSASAVIFTYTLPSGLVYWMGFTRFFFDKLKNGRSIVSRWSRSGKVRDERHEQIELAYRRP